MVMEKKKLKQILQNNDQFLWRSIYGNVFNVGGNQMEDVKVYSRGPLVLKSYNIKKDEHIYLSSADNSFDMILNNILRKQFIQRTKYEK